MEDVLGKPLGRISASKGTEERTRESGVERTRQQAPNQEASLMDKLRLFGVAIIFFAAVASPAFAGKTSFTADLKGSSEVPPTDSTATGKADVTYDDSSKTLTWTITYSGLSGPATAAHFHGPAREGENAGPMITISPLASPIKGSAVLTDDQSKALTSGNIYINVHTAKYPNGEIRNQLKPAS